MKRIRHKIFSRCNDLTFVDLRAIKGLDYLETVIFNRLTKLKCVLLWNGLETIKVNAFADSGLESFIAPASLKKIEKNAFMNCQALRHVDLSACTLESDNGDFFSEEVFKDSSLESIMLPRALRVIGNLAFAHCRHLKSVSFGENPMLEKIESKAFFDCGLESFEAPPRLKKIGDMAFGGCGSLREFKLNEGI